MRVKSFISLLIILLLMFLTGCWDYSDFNELALVAGVGIDMDEKSNEITVTIQYYIPGAGSSTKETKSSAKELPVAGGAVKAKGTTIFEALSKIQEVRRKKLFYGYINVFVIGENAAKKIMKEVIWLIDRSPNVRSTAYLAITEGKAEDVLCTADPNTTVTISRNIHELIDQSTISGSAFPVSLEDFDERMVMSGTEPIAPRVIVISTEKTKNEGTSKSIEYDEPIKINKLKEGYQIVNGIAAFKEDKLVGWLNKKESTGLGYISNKKMKVYENVNNTSTIGIKNTLAFYVTKSKSKIKVQLKDSKPVITVNTKIEVDLRKYAQSIDADLLTSDTISVLEKKLESNVWSEINAAITKSQKDLKSDILGFGFAFYRKYPKLWHKEYEKKWEDIFPDIQIDVDVNAKIVNTGTSIMRIPSK